MMFFGRITLASLFATQSAADEMAFVDITASDEMTVRFLDVPVKSKAGIAGLFERDPMAPHDWTSTALVDRTLDAVTRAAKGGSGAVAGKVAEAERSLSVLYGSLAKNEHSLLERTAVRYALHRHFTEGRLWSIKGLEPAGNAWITSLPVTPDVRQLTKYIVPGYMLEKIYNSTGRRGLDLRQLAVFAVALEQLIHSEMSSFLYSVMTTLELPLVGGWTEEELLKILDTFMMVFALGSDLEVSTKRAAERLAAFLTERHQAWWQLRAFVKEQLTAAVVQPRDFTGLLAFVEGLAAKYGSWQSRDCSLAKEKLQAAEGFSAGRLPLGRLAPHSQPGHRALFTESQEHLKGLGATDGGDLVAANYLQSQEMCLSTASFYSVCCPDPCTAKLALLEGAIRAPQAAAGTIAEALQAPAASRPGLEALGTESGGAVDLHGRGLARWLHQTYPMECPMPSEKFELNPRTADEWMHVPADDVHETERLITELTVGVSKFAKLDLGVTSWEEAEEDVMFPAYPIDVYHEESLPELVEATSTLQALSRGAWRFGLALVLLGSMLGVIRAVFTSAMDAGKKKDVKARGRAERSV